jgi:hypothetical protein
MNTLQKAALLTLLPDINPIHSCTCMHAFRDSFDVLIDWHEFASYLDELARKGYLDELARKGLLDRTGTDRAGRCLYQLPTNR